MKRYKKEADGMNGHPSSYLQRLWERTIGIWNEPIDRSFFDEGRGNTRRRGLRCSGSLNDCLGISFKGAHEVHKGAHEVLQDDINVLSVTPPGPLSYFDFSRARFWSLHHYLPVERPPYLT